MAYQYKTLPDCSFDELFNAFKDIFSDYAVDVSYMNRRNLENRAIKNGYNPKCSVGVYFQNKLVGFSLTGLDSYKGKPSAFDIMTGIKKQHRGKGIANHMFNEMLKELKANHINSFFLEVLKKNTHAIRAYHKSGFKITRTFDCFDLSTEHYQFPMLRRSFFDIQAGTIEDLNKFENYIDWIPSWENSFSSIRRIPDDLKVYCSVFNGEKAGLLVYYPGLQWLMSLIIKPQFRRKGMASSMITHLLEELSGKVKTVKILNIPAENTGTISFIRKSGFELLTSQYEMYYKI